MKTNTSVRDAEPHNNTCPMVWRVDQSPHTGPKAFAAMRQNVARKQCTTTPQAIGKATRPSQEATRYPEGGTSKTKNLLGQGATRMQPRGKGGKQPQNHKQTTKSPSAKGEANRKHRDETCRAKAHKQARKERQQRHTKTDPSKGPNKEQPGGEESTAIKGC